MATKICSGFVVMLIGLCLATTSYAQQPNPGGSDIFSSSSNEPVSDCVCSGQILPNSVVLTMEQIMKLRDRGIPLPCGACCKGPPDHFICWTSGTAYGANGVGNTPPRNPPSKNSQPKWPNGGQPPADCGKVCPNEMGRDMKAAAAAGCRWLGAVLDYDICANPGFGKYPQCAALNTPAKNAGPSDCQIWAGVIMPTRNCERYNANNPGHHYDCSVWCKSFGRDTGAPGRAPRYPPICDKYIRGRGSGNGQSCVAAPFSVKNDVPGAAPSLRYTLGFEVGFSGCLEKQVSVQNLALMALASKVKQVAALLMIVTAPQVIDAVLHPPGASINPNPYLRGKEEGFRLCDWAVKVSPVLVRRCPAPVEPVTTAPSPPAETSCTPDEPGFGSPAGLPVQGFDCFPCTLYYLEKQPYTRPESSAPTSDVRLQRVLSTKYGSLIPQGPKLPCWRMRDQKLGQPGWATPQSIFRELQQAGPGAKAMIFFKTRGNPVGHVFAGENVAMYDPATGRIEGRVKLWDPQQGWDGRSWFFNPDIVWWGIYRIQ